MPKIDQKTALTWLRAPWLVKCIIDQIQVASRTMEGVRLARAIEEARGNPTATPGAS